MKKQKKRRWPIVVGVVVLLLAAVLIAKHDLIRMIYYSNVDPLQPLNVDGEWAGGTAYRNVQYSEVSESDYLNLYVPDADAPAPLIVVVHGGGFVLNDCESRQAELFYQYFRDHGYACATINYRLAQEAAFPAAVEDVKCAVRFLRANADQYGYDASKITIWGESAGGYLSVITGVTTEEEFRGVPFIGEDALAEPVSGKVDVILDYYGAVELESKAERAAAFAELGVPGFIVDIAAGWLKDPIKDMPWAETCEDAWMGKRFDELTDEEKAAVSPLHYADKNLTADSDLKILIWHGDADITVPWTQSKKLYDLAVSRLGEENVTFEIIRNAKHADEDMYSDARLGQLKEWLDAVLAEGVA